MGVQGAGRRPRGGAPPTRAAPGVLRGGEPLLENLILNTALSSMGSAIFYINPSCKMPGNPVHL